MSFFHVYYNSFFALKKIKPYLFFCLLTHIIIYFFLVPPTIISSETSSDVMVRENANVTLRCRARGYPKPKINWRRENGKPIEFGNWQELKNVKVKMRKF